MSVCCHTACSKNSISHSSVYSRGYCGPIILLYSHYHAGTVVPLNKSEFLFHSIFYCFQSNSHGYYLNNIWFYFIMIHTCKCFDDRGTWINVFYHYIQIFSWTQKVCNKCLLIDFTGQLRKVVDWKLRNMSSWPLLKKFNDSWHVSLLP